VVTAEVTTASVEDELIGAQAWANRTRIPLEWNADRLELRATLMQPETNEPFYLIGTFKDYRACPPAWTFAESDWTVSQQPKTFPANQPTPYGASVFTKGRTGPVICAPFNLLAYAEAAGPHGDWGTPSQWLTITGHARATTVGDMLALIWRDLNVSRGRMN
jgi:hypothetical protein